MSALQHTGSRPQPLSWSMRLTAYAQRLALGTIAGLVLAGIVHIVTILLIPHLSEQDATSAYFGMGTSGHAELVPASSPRLREQDPYAVTAICSYDLAAGPVRVVAHTGSLPLGLTVQRRGGGVIYAITDRAAIRGVLEFVVLTEAQQNERIANDDDNQPVRELRIVSDVPTGLIVARVPTGRASDRADAEALVTSVACGLAD
jgi:uncharacterized membrane protein